MRYRRQVIVASHPALGLSSQSSFVSGPMAISVIGGLIASTLITLVIVPVLYRIIEGFKERRGHGPHVEDEGAEAPAGRHALVVGDRE